MDVVTSCAPTFLTVSFPGPPATSPATTSGLAIRRLPMTTRLVPAPFPLASLRLSPGIDPRHCWLGSPATQQRQSWAGRLHRPWPAWPRPGRHHLGVGTHLRVHLHQRAALHNYGTGDRHPLYRTLLAVSLIDVSDHPTVTRPCHWMITRSSPGRPNARP